MKKYIILTLIVTLTFSLYAKKVEIEVAKTVAKNHYVLQFKKMKGSFPEDPVIVETINLKKEDETLIYVFNFSNGFTIISANDAIDPVLGFSLTGRYTDSNMPPALIDLMEHYKNQIEFTIKDQHSSSDETLALWAFYKNPEIEKNNNCEIWPKYYAVTPLITTEWNQDCLYNNKCPYDVQAPAGFCNHVPAGCVAIAMAQVMKYWNFPSSGSGSHGYYDGGACPGAYGYQFADFGNTTYNWDEMPDRLPEIILPDVGKSLSNSVDAVSTLIYHCGVSVNMNYGHHGSSAQTSATRYGLVHYFGYSSSANFKVKSNYSNNQWETILRSDLDFCRPVIYRGHGGQGGHAFVLDGYTKMQTESCTYSALFHINWGWEGIYNGYFCLTDLSPGSMNFDDYQAAVVNITPPNLNYTAPATPSYISQPACSPHYRDEEVEYFVPVVNNATSYEWNITGINSAEVSSQGRYAKVWSHQEGTATLSCRALNHGIPGPWQTKTIIIEDNMEESKSREDEINITKSDECFNNSERVGLKNNVLVYPNPAFNNIHISLPKNDNCSLVELIDNQGVVVKAVKCENSKLVVNTNDVFPGLYIVKISTNKGVLIEKVIISKK